ncbi:hypothetical protein [Dawidia soli]|uniref:Uncharacterized protein n=1 Tax=Dawidia soli TaxID=2782352 RepID=A0AAP2GEQ9_9BACT|nr:hypothetical protein [Dawidia soli]MBT1688657.1 hypothetical protein [Dawidia soli]
MNFLKIMGIVIIVATGLELLRIVTHYSSGNLESWPFGVEIGAAFAIWLGIFLIRRGNKQKKSGLQ